MCTYEDLILYDCVCMCACACACAHVCMSSTYRVLSRTVTDALPNLEISVVTTTTQRYAAIFIHIFTFLQCTLLGDL